MTTEFHADKDLEGKRIQPLIAAVGALPAAALVFSNSNVAEGAPLFVAAIVFFVGTYFMWMCADAVVSICDFAMRNNEAKRAQHALRVGAYMSWATFAYGLASLAMTCLGFVAVFSSLTFGVSIEAGFRVCLAIFLLVGFHLGHALHLRNAA